MDTTDKKPQRITGAALRLAARLSETPGVGRLIYNKLTRDLGLSRLQELDIPLEVVPFRPLHLGAPAPKGGQHG